MLGQSKYKSSIKPKARLRFGLIAEYLAIIIYKLKFYKVLGHRIRNYLGEIDIIAVRNNQIVFIEVKARSNSYDEKLISTNQRIRIKRAALLFLKQNPKFQNHQIRFDLVIVVPYKFPIIIQNAW